MTTAPPARPAKPLLVLDLPGGARARFHAPNELTPRRTRQLDILMAELGPLIGKVTIASRVARGETVDDRDLPGEPLTLTRQQATDLAELNDVVAWTYLKHVEDPSGERREYATVDDLLDAPAPVYKAVVVHAAQLHAEHMVADGGFGVDALPDDLDEADPDLPTSA